MQIVSAVPKGHATESDRSIALISVVAVAVAAAVVSPIFSLSRVLFSFFLIVSISISKWSIVADVSRSIERYCRN